MTSPKITIIGSINMDLVTESPRFPKIGETLLGTGFHQFMGGKGANQAVAAARLNAKVHMIGAVGQDNFGRTLLAGLQYENVNIDAVNMLADAPTGIANITVAEQDNHIIVVSGANFALTAADIEAAEQHIAEADIVVSQLEIPLNCVLTAAQLAKKHAKPFILNPAPAQILPPQLLDLVSVLTPNAHELAISLNQPLNTPLEKLIHQCPCQVITTLGADGVLYNDLHGRLHRQPAFKIQALDTTGAGDTFNAALAVFWQQGITSAVRYANAAAALSITALGAQTGMPTLQELHNFLTQYY